MVFEIEYCGIEAVYVEKEFVAQPYTSTTKEETIKEVIESNVVNKRKTMKVRISKRR